MVTFTSVLFLLFTSVLANTEKAIFLGPEPVTAPLTHPTLSDLLRLDTLTPANGTLRTRLAAQFPAPEHPRGTATWLILDNLTPHQRYEVRVCWAATQPTEFTLSTFSLSTVWDTPELMASLHAYSTSRQAPTPERDDDVPPLKEGSSSSSSERQASMLFLRILAAADYFTTDASLMRNVPPVHVDIILDPFLLNVLPRSLAGIACYIVGVAVVAYFLAARIASGLQGLIAGGSRQGNSTSTKKRQ
ncbi:hypothetical protein C8A01DRAFT_12913 [Parachaetomium inaequale]|uniref:Uncharacterized protein n=1 Tax=Parachaetomium inaequale TaxID=2588326 RepID=A0AAN6PM07_9PEZI|nr:hypothetical protein C8A01DRAFT_12913 [Parachaetomium inaequale]